MAAWGIFLDILVGVVIERPTGLWIEAGGPIQFVDILLAGHERAVVAVMAVLPGFVAGFAGARDGVGPPQALPGVEVSAINEAADAVFAAGSAHDRNVTHDQWRQRQSFRNGGIGDLAFPDLFARCLV